MAASRSAQAAGWAAVVAEDGLGGGRRHEASGELADAPLFGRQVMHGLHVRTVDFATTVLFAGRLVGTCAFPTHCTSSLNRGWMIVVMVFAHGDLQGTD